LLKQRSFKALEFKSLSFAGFISIFEEFFQLLPLEIPRKLVFFWKMFEKLAKKGEIGLLPVNFWHFRLKNQLPPLFFSIFAIFRPHFHQLFATITPKTLETWRKKKLTSGEKSTSVSCFSSFEAKKVKFYKLFAKILR
jgi:hypothetical protein